MRHGDAVIGAPTLAVGGIEYTHYFTEQMGMNFFVDAGDAAESFSDMKLSLGYGVGLAFRTPAGQFFVDLAFGQRVKLLRFPLSIGIGFVVLCVAWLGDVFFGLE